MYGDYEFLDVASEVLRLTEPGVPGSPLGRVPQYGGGWGDLLPDAEVVQASVTDEAVDAYIVHLAAERGLSHGQMTDGLLRFTGGSRDPETLASAAIFLSEQCHGEAISLSDISAAERHAAAGRGHALPDGSYPVRNKRELHAAAVLAASGHGDAKSARALIRKRASELGVPLSSLPGFSRDDDGDKTRPEHDSRPVRRKPSPTKRKPTSYGRPEQDPNGPTQGGENGGGVDGAGGGGATAGWTSAPASTLALAARDDDTIEGLALRHPEFASHLAGVKTSGKAHPGRPRKIGTKSRAHVPELEDPSVDHQVSIDRYLVMVRGISTDKPHGANRSDGGPKPYKSPGPSGKPQD